MKRFFVLLLMVTLVFSLTACGASNEEAFTYEINEDNTITITGYNPNEDAYFLKHYKIIIPSKIDGKKVTVIGESAFSDYKAFAFGGEAIEIVIPDGIMYIEKNAFAGSTIANVNIPSSVISIGVYAFAGCDYLSKITIPGNVKNLGDYAFYGCSDLTEITILDGVEIIGTSTFAECPNLNKAVIPGPMAQLWKRFYDIPYVYTPESEALLH